MAPEVDHPTYEIVGRLERYDERDNVFSRERLVPGSAEEVAYHTTHPELAEIDRRITRFIQQAEDPTSTERDQILSAYYQAVFGSIASLGLPDAVDGPVASHRVEADPVETARRIKDLAHRLGADMVRIGPLNPAWVYSHRGTPSFFEDYRPNPPHFSGVPEAYTGLEWGDPISITHRYAISLAFRQDDSLIRTSPSAVSDFETGRVYALGALLSVQLARYIRGLGWPARAHHMRNYGVLLVPVAVDSGIGELGRCGYVMNPEFGTNLRLACVTTDLPMALDKPRDLGVQDFCRRCKKCAENCPPRAIPTGDPVVVRGGAQVADQRGKVFALLGQSRGSLWHLSGELSLEQAAHLALPNAKQGSGLAPPDPSFPDQSRRLALRQEISPPISAQLGSVGRQ